MESFKLDSEEGQIVDVVSCDIEFEGTFRVRPFPTLAISRDQLLPVVIAEDFLGEIAVHLERKRHLRILVSIHGSVSGVIVPTSVDFHHSRLISLDHDGTSVVLWLLSRLGRLLWLLARLSCLFLDDLVDFHDVDGVLLVEADVTVGHQKHFEELLLAKVFREEHYKVFLCESFEGDTFQAEDLRRDRVGDYDKPGCLLVLREVVDGDHLRISLVSAAKSDAELGLAALLQSLAFLRLVDFVDADDGPADLSDRHFLESLPHLFQLLGVVETDSSPGKD